MNHGQPLESVVVGTDFSDGADAALQRCMALPLHAMASVTLVHVVAEQEPDSDRAATEALAAVRDRAQDLAQAQGRRDLLLGASVVHGDPASELMRIASARKADIVVIGRRGRRGLRELLLGTTAERLVRRAEVPLLLINEAPKAPYRRLLVPTDFTATSLGAARLAGRLLDPATGTARLLHVYDHPFRGMARADIGPSEVAKADAVFKERASADANVFVGALRPLGLEWRVGVRPGDPMAEILDEAEGADVDLIAIGTSGKSAIERFFVGSVAAKLVQRAPCDLLVSSPRTEEPTP